MSIKLPPFFSDNMVLQRDAEIKIWGFAASGAVVKISFTGRTFTAEADENGEWLCNLGKFPASCQPQEMQICAERSELIIKNILIGDVWLCSGQSNMELCLSRTVHNYPDELTVSNSFIRQLKVPQVYNFTEPQKSMQDCAWQDFNPHSAPDFTAAGYFFAKKLTERYKIPVGLIASAVGGTPVSAHMSAEMLKNFPDDLAEAEKCKDAAYTEKIINEYEAYSQDYHKRLNEAERNSENTDGEEIGLCEPVKQGTGVYRYKKTINIPKECRGKNATIFLGTCIDMDEVFINGEKLGTIYYRYPPREYKFKLPESETLTIEIRLLCFNGFGGFTAGKNYFIATDNYTIDIEGGWKRHLGTTFEDRKPQTFFQYKPTGLFNGMVSPLLDYKIKGIIWYQGESDAGNPERYAEKLMTLIKGWRALQGDERLPFIQTQLAQWDGGADWNLLREQQKMCLVLPNTGLALTHDLGENNDLHPQNKRDVGERLARLAMRLAYGEKLPPNLFEMYNLLQN